MPQPAVRRRRSLLLAAGPVVLSFSGFSGFSGVSGFSEARAATAPQASGGAGGNATVVAVRLWPAREYTRITIESDRALSARHSLVDAPQRLTVDLEGLELDAALRELVGQVRPDDPFIQGVRAGQYQPRVVRIVFDLKQAVRPEQFALLPVAPYQHRLIFDLYPTEERDPLLALVREREEANERAARAVRDSLSDFIAGIEGRRNGVAGGASAPSSGTSPALPPRAPAPTAPAPVPMTPAPPRPPAPPTAAERQRVERLIIVAIDPGHGGEDPGAIGPTGLREKDVVLALALELRERLNAVSGMRAMLTRESDHFVPLWDRVRKARRVQADLFVSLHADAFMRREARGASVFALSTRGASSAAARWMAERENAADQVGGVNVGSVRDPLILQTMLDMSTTAQIKDSLVLGREVLGRLDRVGELHKAEVEQAGFAVLKAPDIPSILIETAFISNPQEEKRLRDPAYRTRLAGAIASGIRRYFAKRPPVARTRQLG
ncbi:MAG: N-acetylmuramoyl-L-alanine amidase [Burkholderiales bacterium]|nr:N-acetylmuramoyl-L-alanine amidase [Burkholderiales bacterium]